MGLRAVHSSFFVESSFPLQYPLELQVRDFSRKENVYVSC
jgi:hypothetical protein